MSQPRLTLTEHLQTWQAWSYRDMVTRAVAQAERAGETERVETLTRGLALEPMVDPLAALAANDELVRLLSGWRWHAVRAAREAGAAWQQIARTTHTTAEQARAAYLDHIERAEKHTPALTDTAAYRAVLDDPPPTPANASPSPGTNASSPAPPNAPRPSGTAHDPPLARTLRPSLPLGKWSRPPVGAAIPAVPLA